MSTLAAAARRPRRTILGIVGRLLRGVILIGLAILTGGFIVFVQTLDRGEADALRRADGIVALTGGAERVSAAFELLSGGLAGRLLVSGVNPSTSRADLMRTAPEARRFLDCCIELGYAAENTIGNARETLAWVRRHRIRSLIVVTSNYHMPRALAEIGDAAPGLDLIPHAVVSERTDEADWWSDGQRLRLLASEYLKYLVVLARTHLYRAAPYGGTA